ncbi:hypothetical protein SAMN02799624_05287 [Paenibacillus sp. UNC496MF]|uniref:hypothetical protein n=1 Tax=Paenibacillus sp. UNC496MF TaxID=1502753 RepID=UPI0008E05B76|nr:hypothetical protein [Paenibacillus sp. UNC496MF]SFJ63536.1 hypothetical protein SAMN02799624_05287 [Paenibacillus sp. UNC496MF]
MHILNHVGLIFLGYLLIGLIMMGLSWLYYKLTNRYTGGGLIDFGWQVELLMGMTLWPIWVLNLIGDIRSRRRLRRERMRKA